LVVDGVSAGAGAGAGEGAGGEALRRGVGVGATVGAVNTPLAYTEPQAAPPQPWPAIAD